MNLFDNILAKANPLPDVKSQFMSGFQQPQKPIVQQKKPSMTLFSDEYTMLGKMKADGLADDEAMNLLKQRRTDLLDGNTTLDEKEQSMLLKMQADNLSAKEATALLKQRRADQFDKKYSEGNIAQKGAYNALMLGAGATEKTLQYAGNILDFATFGKLGFGEDVKRMEQVTQSPEFNSTAYKAGQVLPDVALGVSPIGGGYLAGAKGMGQLALRSGVVGAGFGATQPIMEKGSQATMGDIATGAGIGAGVGVVATPVISKALKYGKAGYYGGLSGAGKSIARDVKGGIQAITPSGANISTKANRFNAKEIRDFTKTTGQSPGDFATSRGMTKVGDDAVVEATNLWQKSKEQADEALQAIKGRFRFTDEGEDLLKTTINDLDVRLTTTKSPDAKRISQLKAKYEDSGLTMSEINEVKRAYANNYKYSFVDAGSEPALRSRNLQDAIRKWQFKVAEENGLTNLKDINKTTQGWKMFADSLSKKIQGSSGNNNVSLTDWIALSGGTPENIALYLGKKLASSDKSKSLAIKLFSKKTKPSIIQASKADIQQANFQKNVNRGVSGAGNRSGGESLVRPVGLLPAPSGKATGARNFRVNQSTDTTTGIKEKVNPNVKRPGTTSKGEVSIVKKMVDEKARESYIRSFKNDIARATEAARYGGTGNTRIETAINSALSKKEITRQEAVDIVMDIIDEVSSGQKTRFSYIDMKALNNYANDLFSNKKIESFGEMIASKGKSEPPTKFNTLGQKKSVITPQSPIAYELGSMGKRKVIQPKRLQDISTTTPRGIMQKFKDNLGIYHSTSLEFAKKTINEMGLPDSDKKLFTNALEQVEKRKGYNTKTDTEFDSVRMSELKTKIEELSGYKDFKVSSIAEDSGKTVTLHRAGEVDRTGHGGIFFSDNPKVVSEIYGGFGENRNIGAYDIQVPDKKYIKSYRSVIDAYLDVGPKDNKWKIARDLKDNGGRLSDSDESYYYKNARSIMQDYGTTGWMYDFNRKLDKAVGAEMKKQGVKVLEYTNTEDLGFSQLGLEGSEFVVYDKSIIQPKSSANQATGPRVIGKMGKLETKTTPQSPTAGERGFTVSIKKPIVKRASDSDTLYHGSTSMRELKDFDLDISMQKAKQGSGIGGSFAEGPGIYLTSSKTEATGYGPKVSEFKIQGANIIDKNGAKSLSRQEVSNLLSKIDKDTLQRAIDDWGSKNDLVDNIMEQGNSYEQLMDVWASVFSQQNPKGFVNAVRGIGIDALKVPKDGTTHYVIYNPDKFTSKIK